MIRYLRWREALRAAGVDPGASRHPTARKAGKAGDQGASGRRPATP